MRYWTADEHLGHRNIIEYSGRPFADPDAMNIALIDIWNSVVGVEDEVWVLGDVALGRLTDGLSLIELLNGRKVLVPGNHDRCWHGHSKGARSRARYLDAGFAEIVDGPTTATVVGVEVVVDHFPYLGDSRAADRYVEHRPVDHGRWLLHGHVHERWRQRDRMINVGVDAWAGRPVPDETLAALIAAGPADVAPPSWT